MNKQKLKQLTVLLAAITMMSCAAACGEEAVSGDVPQVTAEAAAESAEVSQEAETLKDDKYQEEIEILRSVLYSGDKQLYFPCKLSDLGEGFEIRPIYTNDENGNDTDNLWVQTDEFLLENNEKTSLYWADLYYNDVWCGDVKHTVDNSGEKIIWTLHMVNNEANCMQLKYNNEIALGSDFNDFNGVSGIEPYLSSNDITFYEYENNNYFVSSTIGHSDNTVEAFTLSVKIISISSITPQFQVCEI